MCLIYCPNCGSPNPDDARYCQNCGAFIGDPKTAPLKGSTPMMTAAPAPQSGSSYSQVGSFGSVAQTPAQAPPYGMPTYGTKNEVVAVLISFILPGVGHIYAGKTKKGVLLLILYIVLFLTVIGIIGSVIIWIYALIDSYKTVQAYNAFLMQYGRAPTEDEF